MYFMNFPTRAKCSTSKNNQKQSMHARIKLNFYKKKSQLYYFKNVAYITITLFMVFSHSLYTSSCCCGIRLSHFSDNQNKQRWIF